MGLRALSVNQGLLDLGVLVERKDSLAPREMLACLGQQEQRDPLELLELVEMSGVLGHRVPLDLLVARVCLDFREGLDRLVPQDLWAQLVKSVFQGQLVKLDLQDQKAHVVSLDLPANQDRLEPQELMEPTVSKETRV
jgi:hypothetical protein